MSRDILEYIENEKSFSEFKIKTLERTSSLAKDRLIKKEREFVHYDFEKIPFSSISECRNALDLFRVSKREFLKKYNKLNASKSFDRQMKFIEHKFKNIKTDEVGVVDGHRFRTLSGKAIKNTDNSERSVYVKIKSLCKDFLKVLTIYARKNGSFPTGVDDVFDFLPECYDNLQHLPGFLRIMEEDDINSVVHKTEKSSLIVLNMTHSSNEKINIVFSRLYDNEGTRIVLAKSKFSNCSIDGDYYKSILIGRDFAENLNYKRFHVGVGRSRRAMEQILDVKVWLRLIIMELEEIF